MDGPASASLISELAFLIVVIAAGIDAGPDRDMGHVAFALSGPSPGEGQARPGLSGVTVSMDPPPSAVQGPHYQTDVAADELATFDLSRGEQVS